MRLIDADALIISDNECATTICRDCKMQVNGCADFFDIIENATTIEPERKTERMVKILADVLDGSPLTQPCDCLWKPEGWCKEHCKAGQSEPDAECWLKYAEVKADE